MAIFGAILSLKSAPGTIVFVAVLFSALIFDGGEEIVSEQDHKVTIY